MKFNKNQSLILGVVLLIAVLVIQLYKTRQETVPERVEPVTKTERPADRSVAGKKSDPGIGREAFNRNPARMIYTKHARCRMDCRSVSEKEVEQILKEGEINWEKSDPGARPDPRYAVEGNSRDGQRLRIIFAPSKRGMVVITCIDLEKEWACTCD